MVRKSKGRQKVEMVKMTNDSNLQVTFSKRRSGLFKKASELCTLCGAEVAIIVFSPGRKVFSFGHPCVESLIERYLTRNPTSLHHSLGIMQLIEAHRNANIVRKLNLELTQVTNELEQEKKRGEELSRAQKANHGQCSWEGPIEEMELAHCEQLAGSLDQLKKLVGKEIDRIVIQNSITNPNPFFGASIRSSSSHHPAPIINPMFGGMPLAIAPPPPPGHPHGWNPGYGRFF